MGLTVSVAGFVTPPYDADIVTVVTAATFGVVISNFAEVAPAATVTFAGTAAAALELLNATRAPSAGAGRLRYTVPIAPAPDATEAGLTVTELSTTGVTVKIADLLEPNNVAVTIT